MAVGKNEGLAGVLPHPPQIKSIQNELAASNDALQHMTSELAKAHRRLALLTRVANGLILGDSPDESLKSAFDATAEELGAKFYFNYHIDQFAHDNMILRSSGGLSRVQERAFRCIEVGQHLCGQVAKSRSPLIIDNVHLSDDAAAAGVRAMGIMAYAGFPLLAHGELFGTIAFGSIREAKFSDADVEFLNNLADQFAATLDRARLMRNLRKNETLYRAALTVGRMGAWETDLVARTRAWSCEGQALFGLTLDHGRGSVGGEHDEFRSAMHPDDRHLVQTFHEMAHAMDVIDVEYRIVRPDGKIVWLAGRGQVVERCADGKARRLVSVVSDITDRKKNEDHVRLLMREVSHRSKNLLGLVQAIARRTIRSAPTTEEFEHRFAERLQGLAASHDMLVNESWQGAPLDDLVARQLAPFAETGGSRLVVSGPKVIVAADAAQALGLAFHELATNAVKYGALSMAAGTVTVSWVVVDGNSASRSLRLNWREHGGPVVAPPTRQGFGRIVIERMVAQSLNGHVTLDFAPEGLSWTLAFPTAELVREPATPSDGH